MQYDSEEAQSVIRYAKIAMQLQNKTIRDVTLRRRWMSRKENSKRKKEATIYQGKPKIGRKWPHSTHLVGCKGDSFCFFF